MTDEQKEKEEKDRLKREEDEKLAQKMRSKSGR
jgi:hypothetical protein